MKTIYIQIQLSTLINYRRLFLFNQASSDPERLIYFNRKLFLLLVISLLTCFNSVEAQQDAQYTQYMYNTISVNPAYAGSRGVFSGLLLHRSQWVGLDGAPTTQTLSFNTPLDSEGTLGLGVSVINDEIGPSEEQNLFVDFSYTINTSANTKLSFGLKAGGNILNVDFSKTPTLEPGDPLFEQNIDRRFSPNFGVGLYWHSNDWYVGLSVPNFLETDHYDDNGANSDTFLAQERVNYYLIGGYVFDLSPSLKLKPAFLTKYVSGAPLQVDLSANLLINEKLTLGAAYRWSAALSAMAGFQITDGIMIGYAYDFETTRLRRFNSGSHEVFLRVDLFSNASGVYSPRFF
ncbi:PorP/SprF family type IX secretion system membrane protein [Spongiivirga citrea]|uniref:Type IX secretion system membrane protein PorP/SprF n=1 Tax=Spongiivirga citrea TaxID=1481457 RepID=A0A6M0CQS8_9FLAO|nr:type IX secretion system membrane protein PorP/SprF [Spongiivirga citrea]NER16280.1 type IX secretion system membrane protein PorP/SprF [Spongiivirga citrea]